MAIPDPHDLLAEIASLRALLEQRQAANLRKDARIATLENLFAATKQAAFDKRSEKADPNQLDLALEDIETAMTAVHAEDRAAQRPAKKRNAKRGALPAHLPRIEVFVEPDS